MSSPPTPPNCAEGSLRTQEILMSNYQTMDSSCPIVEELSEYKGRKL